MYHHSGGFPFKMNKQENFATLKRIAPKGRPKNFRQASPPGPDI